MTTRDTIITLRRAHLDEMFAHALCVLPEECCGLVGGRGESSMSTYPLRNTAGAPQTRYEACPEELFRAQKQMRVRGEELFGIYHSHPRAAEPAPSDTDVRLAYYPDVTYFIVGFRVRTPVLRAFRIYAEEERWEKVAFDVV